MVLRSLHERDPVRQNLLEVKEAGRRAEALTRQLLVFSRRQVLAVELLDLNALIGDTEKMLRRLIGEDIELATVLAQRIRAKHPEVQVVFMSGYAGDVVGLERLLEDGDRFIQKPFSADALLAKIRFALTHRR
jgi:CheY-like chemotaxis protein